MIDRATVDRIMDATQIVDVVSDFVTLRKAGVNYKGLCPFHDDRTPSFVVSPSKGLCKCFACGKGGNAVHFIMEHEQLSYPDALRYLARKYNIEIKERELTEEEKQAQDERESMFVVNEWACQFFQDQLYNTVDGRAIGMTYFRSRGFRDDIIKKFQLGYSPSQRDACAREAKAKGYKEEFLLSTGLCYKRDNGQLQDRFFGRVIFPVHTLSGKVVAFGGRVLDAATKGVNVKYQNSPESTIYSKKKELYGLFLAKQAIVKHDLCFLVEGYTDVISMHQAGIDTAVCACGTALTPDQVKLISQYAEEVILSYDSDEAGQKATLRSLELFRNSPVKVGVLQIPGAKDPDEYIKKYGSERFKALLDGVGNALDFRLGRLKNKYDLKQDAQRLEYVKEAVNMLAERSNPTEQEVYAGRLAEETNISKNAIMTQLADAVKRSNSKRRWAQNQARLQSGEMHQISVPYSAGGSQALGVASAEQRLLAAMLREPSYILQVRAQLSPEKFVLPQQKELYEAFLQCQEQGIEISLSTLRPFVSEEALNELSRLAAQYSDVNCTPDDIRLYLDRIARGTPVAGKAAEMSNDDLIRYLQSMREKKQGTDPAED